MSKRNHWYSEKTNGHDSYGGGIDQATGFTTCSKMMKK